MWVTGPTGLTSRPRGGEHAQGPGHSAGAGREHHGQVLRLAQFDLLHRAPPPREHLLHRVRAQFPELAFLGVRGQHAAADLHPLEVHFGAGVLAHHRLDPDGAALPAELHLDLLDGVLTQADRLRPHPRRPRRNRLLGAGERVPVPQHALLALLHPRHVPLHQGLRGAHVQPGRLHVLLPAGLLLQEPLEDGQALRVRLRTQGLRLDRHQHLLLPAGQLQRRLAHHPLLQVQPGRGLPGWAPP